MSYYYKEHISDYRQWEAQTTAPDYVVHKENLGKRLSMDETALSQGELYTIVTNKDAHGGKGSLVAMIQGTKSKEVIWALCRMPRSKRLRVEEITIDLSPAMKLIAKSAFPNATIVSDRFHVQKLMNEAVSDLRISHRWQAIDQENKEISLAKECGRKFVPHTFDNGDSRRQLLARSRHLIMKHHSRWTLSQRERAQILFREYPDIEEAYRLSMELTDIYNDRKTTDKRIILTKLARWYNKVERIGCKYFDTVVQTMQNNYGTIINYFDHRSTNAAAESFNAKIKAFRAQLRGIADIPFFIFRLSTLFA